MSEQFQEQGGAATMDPSPFRRWFFSAIINRMLRPERLAQKREKFEQQRRKTAAPHRVEFFYQIDDAYSYLAAQALSSLVESYHIELACYLVSGPLGKNAAEPELLSKLASYDASCIAAQYGLTFPSRDKLSQNSFDDSSTTLALAILAAQNSNGFINCAAEVGEALWSGDSSALDLLAAQYGCSSAEETAAHLKVGNIRRNKLGHYSGGMFYYAGEWYWGIDRLYHLERRLRDLGVASQPQKSMLMPRPEIKAGPLKDNASLTLEVYASLRSPYTAIGFDRAVKLATDTGVQLVVRPVLPMVMRGVPVTKEKGLYIFSDAAREAREAGVAFGDFCDPIGEPVRRCYCLYAWACKRGKGIALISNFLSSAFADGINTNTDKGLRIVIERAGLDWQQALSRLGELGWQDSLEANRQAMYAAGLWGVPSFRLLNNSGEQVLALWGQDRLWLVAREIQAQLASQKKQINSEEDNE